VLIGSSLTLPVRDGAIALGTWQGIYFAELDGPRERRATITVIGD
jgi:secondary thiamine-phosphate synthase enzyme